MKIAVRSFIFAVFAALAFGEAGAAALLPPPTETVEPFQLSSGLTAVGSSDQLVPVPLPIGVAAFGAGVVTLALWRQAGRRSERRSKRQVPDQAFSRRQ